MNTTQLPVDFPEVQGAVYRVALSLDAFLVNGLQYGVLQRVTAGDFLQKTAGSLLADLARLEEQAPHTPVAGRPKVGEVLTALRTRCQRLVDLVMGLSSFRTFPLEEVRTTVSQIPLLREACVQQLQELEACVGTPNRFYQSRPAPSTAAVKDFLTNLEHLFTQEWRASGECREPGAQRGPESMRAMTPDP